MPELPFNPEEMKARGYDRETVAEGVRAKEAHAAAAALIAQIEVAFGVIARPRVTLRVARGFDDEWNLSEARVEELSALDLARTWQEVSDAEIEAYQEYFTFADAEGCRFYLPAFMRHYLRSFTCAGYDAVYWACTEPEKLEALTAAERACVEEFLELCHRYQAKPR